MRGLTQHPQDLAHRGKTLASKAVEAKDLNPPDLDAWIACRTLSRFVGDAPLLKRVVLKLALEVGPLFIALRMTSASLHPACGMLLRSASLKLTDGFPAAPLPSGFWLPWPTLQAAHAYNLALSACMGHRTSGAST